jgi:hypothetical protein
VAKQFVVVEVFVAPSGSGVSLSRNHFSVSLDSAKAALAAQPPRDVAMLVKNSDWMAHSTAAPAQEVTYGGEPTHQRFPGADEDDSPMPRSSIALQPESRNEGAAVEPANMAILNSALPEGPASKPVKGCLYFRYDGAADAIRSLELVYDSPAGGKTKLRLF